MGTVGYMSPEQAQGLPVDHRSDIFSFGAMLYEALTGSRPFGGTSAVDTLHQIIHDQPAPVSTIAPSAPAEAQRIVRKCLAKSPDERYQSMKEVAIDLRDLRRQLDSQVTSAVTVATRRMDRRRTWLAAAAALIVVAAASAAWFWRPLELVPRADVGFWCTAFTPDSNAIYYVVKSRENPQGTLFRIPLLARCGSRSGIRH